MTVEYEVAFRDGESASFGKDLNGAMDLLAPQVAAETFPDSRLRRRLTVTTKLPTSVTGNIDSREYPG